jgi:mannose-1-phosphate guanylyltransferase
MFPSSVNLPWGTYTRLKEEYGYKVKRITVCPGQSLSLPYHHWAEHWTLASGHGLVQICDVEYPTGPGDYRFIPLQETDRLTNTGEEELVLIEVQVGDYLGEDDIVRLQDNYGRV